MPHGEITLDNAARMARMETKLDSIESSLSELSALMSRIVRIEERHASADKAIKRMGEEIDGLQARMRVMESGYAGTRVQIGNYERGFWLMVTSGLGYVVAKIKGVL